MRSERDRLEEQLRLVFEGEAWHGPGVIEALSDVEAELAAERPIDGAHSIWEIVQHLTWTYGLVLRKLTGDSSGLAAADDWSPVPLPASEENWAAAVATLRERNAQVRRAATNFPEDRLDSPPVGDPRYSAYTLFIGLTQHDAYHAGQIVLLKRAAQAKRHDA